MFSNGRQKKIKLEEEAISEILVADTDSVCGAEVSYVDLLRKRKKKKKKSKPQQKSKHRLQ